MIRGDSKRPQKVTGKSRRKLSDSESPGVESNPQRAKENIEFLQRGLFPPKATYKYAPISRDEIRLLHLLPSSKKGDTLYSELKVARLDDPQLRFEALSYTWGHEEPIEEMWIKGEDQVSSQELVQPSKSPAATLKERLQKGVRKVAEIEKTRSKTFYVRRNLSDALRYVRENSPPSYDPSQKELNTMVLWVDAICINQEDEEEKSIQVTRIAEIYESAAAVFIWLGKEGEESNMGMDFVTDIPTLEHQENMLSVKGSSAQQWSAFVSLMKRDWFSRRWVVQELALAKEKYMICGDSAVHWDDFVIAVEFFIERFDTIAALYNDSPEFKQKLLSLGDINASGAGKMISVTNEFVRGSERRKSLETLVSELTMFEVGDPRDTVYALMALAMDMLDASDRPRNYWGPEAASQVVFQADYRKSTLQVFKDFIAFCVIGSNSLDILCRKWAHHRKVKRLTVTERVNFHGRRPPAENIQLPSWIGLLKDSAFGMPRTGLQTRVAANSLVDCSDNRRYNACGGRSAEIRFGEYVAEKNEDDKAWEIRSKDLLSNPSTSKVTARDTLETNRGRLSDGRIYVRGFRVNTIQQVSHRLFEGLIPHEWLTLGGWTEESSDIPEELWRTLVADRAPGGKDPPRWYSQALSWAIDKRNSNGDIMTAELIRQGQPQWMVQFLKRVQEVIWNKKFFLLYDHEGHISHHFGIAPSDAQKDDLVCVLLGCSVPVVLSPVEKSDSRYGYKLVGEAYIHGLMDGEILKALATYPSSITPDVIGLSEEFCLI